jgi:L-threonylcarbamoyladenylate synthase
MFLLRDDISDIARILLEGSIICYPTDTIWGIGCDATNLDAVARVTALKSRAPEKGYIVLVADIEMLKTYVPKIHPRVETLLSFHNRPLTVVYGQAVGLPTTVKAADGSVAVRVVQDEFCQELIRQINRPLLSTAAHVHGSPWPATFGGISSEILGGVDYVVKYRQDDKRPGEPSAIARLDRHQEFEFLRD